MQRPNAHPPETNLKPLVEKLVRVGLSRQTARSVLADYPPERIARQLAWLPHRNAKNPAGLLLNAIREDWSSPLGELNPPTPVEAGTPKSTQPANETKQKLERLYAEQRQEKLRRGKLVALEQQLSHAERATLKKQAESHVRRRLKTSWPKSKPIPHTFLNAEYYCLIEQRFEGGRRLSVAQGSARLKTNSSRSS